MGHCFTFERVHLHWDIPQHPTANVCPCEFQRVGTFISLSWWGSAAGPCAPLLFMMLGLKCKMQNKCSKILNLFRFFLCQWNGMIKNGTTLFISKLSISLLCFVLCYRSRFTCSHGLSQRCWKTDDQQRETNKSIGKSAKQIVWLTDAPAAIVCSITEQH